MVKYNSEQISDIFHALADPTRRQMLNMVSHRDLPATDFAEPFNISLPAISKHLKVLEKAKLIKREVKGRTHSFRFQGQEIKKAYQWIKEYEKFWTQNLDQLENFLTNSSKEK